MQLYVCVWQIRMSGSCEKLAAEVRANRSKWYDLNDTEAVNSFGYFKLSICE